MCHTLWWDCLGLFCFFKKKKIEICWIIYAVAPGAEQPAKFTTHHHFSLCLLLRAPSRSWGPTRLCCHPVVRWKRIWRSPFLCRCNRCYGLHWTIDSLWLPSYSICFRHCLRPLGNYSLTCIKMSWSLKNSTFSPLFTALCWNDDLSSLCSCLKVRQKQGGVANRRPTCRESEVLIRRYHAPCDITKD